jgi:hypothetical protein
MDRLHWRAAHDTERVARRLAGRSCDETLLEVVVDKAAIFTAILRRNKLRRDNGLPTRNIRAEYAHEVSVAQQREFQEFCERHADEREVIHQQAVKEFCAEHGPAASHTGAERWS